ncbi:MAG: GNAT family N-acetyltransferase [Rhizobiales bacterium]|nr:GNAT family N-acetyltransferase [Hyphomicrobiales bacterium]
MAQQSYHFHPMTAADLPLMRDWLARPHVAEWWHDANEFEFVSGDLAHHDMAQFIVTMEERPLGYLQCYNMSEWHAGFGPQPPGTRGIDQFIAEPDMVGRGHGSAFIRQFIDGLLKCGTPRVVIDPSPANPRAIRAYEKAGFRKDRLVDTPDGRALLMVRNA